MRRTVAMLAVWLTATWCVAADVFRPRPVEPPAGTLFVCGGGKLPDEIFDAFVKAAGGEKARIVVIPTAAENAAAYAADDAKGAELLARWRDREVADVQFFHAATKREANDDAKLQLLREATGVWIEEGWQSRLADAYVGTPVVGCLRDVLQRNGVVGGTSAGAAILSDPVIVGDAATGETPPTMPGFGLLPGAVIDQHFVVRNRKARLQAVLAERPTQVGFGVDEGTALVVRGRALEVLGESTVTVLIDGGGRRPLERQLAAGERDDLVALSRAALDRLGEPFPPAKPRPPHVPGGSLLIVGGARMTEELKAKFIELAGGPAAKIVVVTSAGDRPPRGTAETKWLTDLGVDDVSVLHPRSRNEADSAVTIAQLAEADGVWFGGGRQWRIVDVFEGTAGYEAFHEVLRRGGVIGGSSAGATIQGEYLVRGSPVVNTIMMADGYERGFNFLPGTAVDQHFTQRGRQPDMEHLKRTYPQLLGLGIDEATAVIVRQTRLEVLGEATVSIYPPTKPTETSAMPDGARAVPAPDVLKTGDVYDLKQFRLLQSAE